MLAKTQSDTRLPVLFIGHGSPMNSIEKNPFTQRLEDLGKLIPRPQAILCISAHWLSAGTWITHMQAPQTIHDFYGFPEALFQIQYPAPGDPKRAEQLQNLIQDPKIHLDDRNWGLDHGTWSVLKYLFPEAKIPVLQLSIDMSEPLHFHFELGKQLQALRSQGVLIVGSGNLVHNLRKIHPDKNSKPFDWAIEFDEWVKTQLVQRRFAALYQDLAQTTAFRLSVPTLDHYLPLLYTLGASHDHDSLRFEYEGFEHGSISMRCLSLGLA